jgi:hypothetical protein
LSRYLLKDQGNPGLSRYLLKDQDNPVTSPRMLSWKIEAPSGQLDENLPQAAFLGGPVSVIK